MTQTREISENFLKIFKIYKLFIPSNHQHPKACYPHVLYTRPHMIETKEISENILNTFLNSTNFFYQICPIINIWRHATNKPPNFWKIFLKFLKTTRFLSNPNFRKIFLKIV